MSVSSLISPTWLRQHLANGLKNIRLLDASWHLDSSRNPREEFLKERIDGAVFFDIDEVADRNSPFSHTLPSPEEFGDHVGKLGVCNNHHVIVYDNNDQYGIFSAPRVWWMFRVFGHHTVSILDGGLPRWKFRGFPTIHGPPPSVAPANFQSTFDPGLVRTLEQMLDNFSTKDEQLVDARGKGRFDGTALEPHPSLPSGHIIGSHNIPYMTLMQPENKILKSKQELQNVFREVGVDLDQAMVATCGSGVTACIVAFAAHMLGKDIPVYDGSWTEWVQSAPKSTMALGAKEGDSEKRG